MRAYYDDCDYPDYYGQPPPEMRWGGSYSGAQPLERRSPSLQGMNCLLGTVIGAAAGAVLAFLPVRCFKRRRDELIKLGAALGGLVGACCDTLASPDDGF